MKKPGISCVLLLLIFIVIAETRVIDIPISSNYRNNKWDNTIDSNKNNDNDSSHTAGTPPSFNYSTTTTPTTNQTTTVPPPHHNDGIHIFVNKFSELSTPFIVCCWLLLATLAKIAFNSMDTFADSIPESCLLILLGVPIGYTLQKFGVTGHLFLTSDLFFHYLLPPIIFDAGYFINPSTFFNNIGTILLYAVIGTIANTFLIGTSMWAVASTANVTISLLYSFLFGALISAVDPVAVLTVFEEVQVNDVLYMLVFGESVLNDAASVVLYRTFQSLPSDGIDGQQVGLAIASFFVVSIFGTIIGVVFGLVAGFVTKYTEQVTVIEPMVVFLMAYMAYLSAETFHFSGIMSILFCGVAMKPYVQSNISRKSHITIKYFLKLLASSCEAVIFMFLGVALVQYEHNFNIRFVAWCVLFITVFRALCIGLLTWLANTFGRMERISKVEQFIMTYGGLRGAVAFCLAILLDDGGTSESLELKRLLVTTTLAVIIFTCFGQGSTMAKLVEKLNVERSDDRKVAISEHLNEKVVGFTSAGIEAIVGVRGFGFWMNLFEIFNQKVMRPCLVRNPEMILDQKLFRKERKMSLSQGVADETSKELGTDVKSGKYVNSHAHTNGGFLSDDEDSLIDHLIPDPDVHHVHRRKRYGDSGVGLRGDGLPLYPWEEEDCYHEDYHGHHMFLSYHRNHHYAVHDTCEPYEFIAARRGTGIISEESEGGSHCLTDASCPDVEMIAMMDVKDWQRVKQKKIEEYDEKEGEMTKTSNDDCELKTSSSVEQRVRADSSASIGFKSASSSSSSSERHRGPSISSSSRRHRPTSRISTDRHREPSISPQLPHTSSISSERYRPSSQQYRTPSISSERYRPSSQRQRTTSISSEKYRPSSQHLRVPSFLSERYRPSSHHHRTASFSPEQYRTSSISSGKHRSSLSADRHRKSSTPLEGQRTSGVSPESYGWPSGSSLEHVHPAPSFASSRYDHLYRHRTRSIASSSSINKPSRRRRGESNASNGYHIKQQQRRRTQSSTGDTPINALDKVSPWSEKLLDGVSDQAKEETPSFQIDKDITSSAAEDDKALTPSADGHKNSVLSDADDHCNLTSSSGENDTSVTASPVAGEEETTM